MIPGKLYRSKFYNTKIWQDIDFDIIKGQYYVSNFLMFLSPSTIFMVVEIMKTERIPYPVSNDFCKILDANGNIGYIRYNNNGNVFIEVNE